MLEYGIPLPKRPPADVNSPTGVEVATDRFIFERLFIGIQSFLPIHMSSFAQSTSPKIRELFKKSLYEEVEIYDKLYEYGKLKNWLDQAPLYRP